MVNALDAANFATARRLVEGATDDQLRAYALDFFKANLNDVDPANTTLSVTLPSSTTGGGIAQALRQLVYKPYFLPVASMLIGKTIEATIDYSVMLAGPTEEHAGSGAWCSTIPDRCRTRARAPGKSASTFSSRPPSSSSTRWPRRPR